MKKTEQIFENANTREYMHKVYRAISDIRNEWLEEKDYSSKRAKLLGQMDYINQRIREAEIQNEDATELHNQWMKLHLEEDELKKEEAIIRQMKEDLEKILVKKYNL